MFPSFESLSTQANSVANEHYDRISSSLNGAGDFDLADVADDAMMKAFAYWERRRIVRQTVLNLLAVGLFHLVEQQLASLSNDSQFELPIGTKLEKITEWFNNKFGLELKKMKSWEIINELRLVANVVKHGKGPAENSLRAIQPNLFMDPYTSHFTPPDWWTSLNLQSTQIPRFMTPMAGDDLFISENDLNRYFKATESLFEDIESKLHGDYLNGD